MSDCVHYITFDKNTIRLEERFIGDDFQKATVQFTLKDSIGRVIGECFPIPVRSLFDITQLIDISIKERIVRVEQTLVSLQQLNKERKHGTEKNKKK